jgi:hypothetical protein
MSMASFTKNLDKNIYPESLKPRPDGTRSTPLTYFTEQAHAAGIGPTEAETAKVCSRLFAGFGMRSQFPEPGNLTRYDWVSSYAQDKWVVDAVMKELGAPSRGPYAPTVEKAFTVTAIQAVFPIWYDSQIVEGVLANPLLPRLVAETLQITSGTADHVVMNEQTWERTMGEIGEWTRFPELSISATNAPIKTRKWGGILKASDEAVRRARLPIFARGLARIGMQLANDLTDFALDVLLSGDGNAGTPLSGAGDIYTVPVSGAPVYGDIVAQKMLFSIGYEPNIMIATRESITDILNMPQYQDQTMGVNSQVTGNLPMVLGMDLLRWDSLASSNWSTASTLMVDTQNALVQYSEGGIMTDFNRVVNGQWSEVATSIQTGFAILDRASRKKAVAW